MRSTRYRVSENLGAEAVLQAHQGNRTCPDAASQHNIHSNQFRDCKRYATGDRIEANAKSSERRLLDRNNRGPEDSVRLRRCSRERPGLLAGRREPAAMPRLVRRPNLLKRTGHVVRTRLRALN